MSRQTLYSDNRLSLIGGDDVVLGKFLQLYDNQMESVTPEGEGLILDWSERYGIEINYTGYSSTLPVLMIIDNYINYINGNKKYNSLKK